MFDNEKIRRDDETYENTASMKKLLPFRGKPSRPLLGVIAVFLMGNSYSSAGDFIAALVLYQIITDASIDSLPDLLDVNVEVSVQFSRLLIC